MELRSVNVRRFRSIEDSTLTESGDFNILIGKNNAGKSTLLSAIDSFFQCIGGGDIITLAPPIGREIDFHNAKGDAPIEITLVFLLSPGERATLKQDIVSEAPPLENAAESIDTLPWLHATLHVMPPPTTYGAVSQLSLRNTSDFMRGLTATDRTILSVNADASTELYERFSNARQRIDGADTLSSFDTDRLRYFMDSGTEGSTRPPIEFLLEYPQRPSLDLDLARRIERIVDSATSYGEASTEIQSLASRMREEAESAYQQPLGHRVSTFAGQEEFVPDYVRKLLTRISAITVLYLRDRRKPIGQEEATRLLDLKVRRGGPEVLRSIQETVDAMMGVQIDAFRSDRTSRRGESEAELDVDNFLVQANGSGIREGLRLVLDYELQEPKILLVEEPEMHLHPALETAMMRYLKRISSDCQVFVTTHSTNFLDTADMRNVYLVSKSDSTQVRLLEIGEAETQIPRELGIRLSSLFMFDRLVFVEGQSDEDIFREWASSLGINLSQTNVGFISMNGVRNLTHFAAERTLSFLMKRRVQTYFVMDRDEQNSDEIAKIQERLGDRARIAVLNRREIENYMVLARPMIELIKQKQQDGTSGDNDDQHLTEELVDSAIQSCAEDLKQIAISKRVIKVGCKPIYPDRKRVIEDEAGTIPDRVRTELDRMIGQLNELKDDLANIAKEQTEVVDKTWETNKLAIVPGDMLLDAVFKKYGVRFRKEQDSVRLAALMHENEISQEIKDIIREIGE